MRVKGWSVGWRDAVSVVAVPVGVAGIFGAPVLGGAVLGATGSLVLGTGVALFVALSGVLVALGGVLQVLTAHRTYRHPERPYAKVGSLL